MQVDMLEQASVQATQNKVNKLESYLPLWLARLIYYEYWPVWALYFPVLFYWLWLSLRARSFTYFTAANPGIELGGFFGESKTDILKKIDPAFLPVTLYFAENTSPEDVVQGMKIAGINFPVICKPDKGERGFNVEKISNLSELERYLEKVTVKIIVQEFITYDTELGILYYRFPDGTKSGITSIVQKELLSVTGDGEATIRELMSRSIRARFQLKNIEEKLGDKMNHISASGEKLLLEPIGNHCRGTQFLNGNKLINEDLVKVFDNVARNIDGFYYGRFDLKIKSIGDMYKGKNIRIMELNGVTSEPAHIYGKDMNLFKAVAAILYNSKLVYRIAVQNKKLGTPYTSAHELISIASAHFKSLKKVDA